jgi:hypothetical protein
MSIPAGIRGEFRPFPRHHGVMKAAILTEYEMMRYPFEETPQAGKRGL